MKIWRRHGHVAQAWNAEDVEIIGIVGHLHAPLVDSLTARRFPIILEDAEFTEHRTTHAHALVARDAAGVDEFLKAGTSRGRKGVDVAGEIRVERRWRYQGPLVRTDGLRHVPQGCR